MSASKGRVVRHCSSGTSGQTLRTLGLRVIRAAAPPGFPAAVHAAGSPPISPSFLPPSRAAAACRPPSLPCGSCFVNELRGGEGGGLWCGARGYSVPPPTHARRGFAPAGTPTARVCEMSSHSLPAQRNRRRLGASKEPQQPVQVSVPPRVGPVQGAPVSERGAANLAAPQSFPAG